MVSKFKPMFEIKTKVGARFKLIKRKVNSAGDEITIDETSWINNVVLDQGLNALSTTNSNLLAYLSVGTGNSPPDVSQTSLDNVLAVTNTSSPTQPQNSYNFSEIPFYVAARKSFRFNAGVAVGNISELGLTSSSGSNGLLFNRALVRDSNGNPTTITVLADEILDVIVEVRVYLPETISGSFDLLDKIGNVIKTVNYIGKPFLGTTNPASLTFQLERLQGARIFSNLTVFSGTLNTGYTTNPSGTIATTTTGNSTESNNYPTARSLVYKCKLLVDSHNFEHKSLSFKIRYLLSNTGLLGFQVEFDTTIPKTSSETLQYSLGFSWDRYVA